MPITSSAKKALRASKRKYVFNLRRKEDLKDTVKEVRDLVNAGDIKGAEAKISSAYQAIDKAVKTKLIKSNTADRKKSRLMAAIARGKNKSSK